MNSSVKESVLFKDIRFLSLAGSDGSLFCSYISPNNEFLIHRSLFVEPSTNEPIFYLIKNSLNPTLIDFLMMGTKKQIINFYKRNINREL